MELLKVESIKEFVEAASKWCQDAISTHGARSIFVPAGQTPVPLYQQWEAHPPGYLAHLDLVQIDDVLPTRPFADFLLSHLPSYSRRIRLIDTGDKIADLAILGLGLNGHVAFHEPGLPPDFFSGCVRLGPTTCETLGISEPSWGLTYGTGAFMLCKSLLMLVRGSAKKAILTRLLEGDTSLPATELLRHKRFTLISDRDAL